MKDDTVKTSCEGVQNDRFWSTMMPPSAVAPSGGPAVGQRWAVPPSGGPAVLDRLGIRTDAVSLVYARGDFAGRLLVLILFIYFLLVTLRFRTPGVCEPALD